MASKKINISIEGGYNAGGVMKKAQNDINGLKNTANGTGGTFNSLSNRVNTFGNNVSKSAGKAKKSFMDFHNSIGMVGNAMSGLIGIGIGAFLVSCVKKAADADGQWKKLNQTLIAHGENVQAADEQVYKLANTYGFATADVRDATLAFEVSGQTMAQISKSGGDMNATMGIAAAKNISVADAAHMVITAYNGQGRGMKQLGINIKDYTDKTTGKINVDKLNDAIIQKTTASLDAQGDSSEATMMRMENATEHLEIALGKALLPVVNKLTDGLVWLTNRFDKLSPHMQSIVTDVTALGIGLVAVSAGLSPLISVVTALGSVGSALKSGVKWIAKYVAGLVGIPKTESTTITKTVKTVNEGGGGGGNNPPGTSNTTGNVLWDAAKIGGGYVAGKVAQVGARVAGTSLTSVARGALSLGADIPGVGEAIAGLTLPGQILGRPLTQFEKTASPYTQQQAEIKQNPQGVSSAHGYGGFNWVDYVKGKVTNFPHMTLPSYLTTGFPHITLPTGKFPNIPFPQMPASAVAGVKGAQAWIGGAAGNTASWINNLGIGNLRPGPAPAYGATPGQTTTKPSIQSDIFGKHGLLDTSTLKLPSLDDIKNGILAPFKNIHFKLPTLNDIKNGILGPFKNIHFKLPSLNDIKNIVMGPFKNVHLKLPSIGSIGSWIKSKIPKVPWKIPGLKTVETYVSDKIKWLKWPDMGKIEKWIQDRINSAITNIKWPWGPASGGNAPPWIGPKPMGPLRRAPQGAPRGPLSDMVVSRMAGIRNVSDNYVRQSLDARFNGIPGFTPIANAMSDHLSYQFYMGDQKTNAEVWNSGSCNCYDGAQLLEAEAHDRFGLPVGMGKGVWNGTSIPHAWSLIGGQPFDMAAKLIRGFWHPPAGPSKGLAQFMQDIGPGLEYIGYGGHMIDPMTALTSGGNCFDMTLGLLGAAKNLFGAAGKMVWGNWGGQSHVWANINGKNYDPSRRALEGTWSPPPQGPSGHGNVVLNFNAPIYGVKDLEDTIFKTLNRAFR